MVTTIFETRKRKIDGPTNQLQTQLLSELFLALQVKGE